MPLDTGRDASLADETAVITGSFPDRIGLSSADWPFMLEPVRIDLSNGRTFSNVRHISYNLEKITVLNRSRAKSEGCGTGPMRLSSWYLLGRYLPFDFIPYVLKLIGTPNPISVRVKFIRIYFRKETSIRKDTKDDVVYPGASA